MRFRVSGAAVLAAVATLLCLPNPTRADNYPVRDGTGTMQTFCAKLWSGVQFPCHILYGTFGGSPTPLSVDGSGNLNVNVVSGGGGGGTATSANQTAIQATPGSDAVKAVSVQGVTGGKTIPVVAAATDTKLDTIHTDLTATSSQLPAALGPTTKANSVSVARATDDGSSTASADSLRYPVSQLDGLTGAAINVTGNGDVVVLDMTGYSAVAFQVSGTFSVTLTTQASNDGANYINTSYFPVSTTQTGNPANTIASAQIACINRQSRYVKLVASSYVSGTAVVTYHLMKDASCKNIAGTQTVGGQLAESVAATGNPFLAALRASTDNRNPASIADGALVNALGTKFGALVTQDRSVPEMTWTGTLTLSNGTSTQIAAACGASIINTIDWIDWSTLANTTAVQLQILNGASALLTYQLPAGAGHEFIGFPAAPPRGTTNTVVNAQLSGSPTGAVTVMAGGHCSK